MPDQLPQRRLATTFQLNSGDFGNGAGNVATLKGYRASARVSHAGGPSDGTLDLTIWGCSATVIAQIATLGAKLNLAPKNTVVLAAGDNNGTPTTVFLGYILQAWADFGAQPEVPLHITAHTGLPQSVIPAIATSYRGSVDVGTIMSGLATSMGLKFENSGVQVQLRNPYFAGSYKSQMRECAEAAGINATIINGTLAIWPKFGFRNGAIPMVSKETGMIGYPSYTDLGIMLKTIFNPSIGFGQKINVQSSLQQATGEWVVYGLGHALDEEMLEGGQWETEILAYSPKRATPPVFVTG
jgi:hypothetical protein